MANNAPWAKFGMLRIPVTSDRPSPIRAYSMPVAIPLRICAAMKLKKNSDQNGPMSLQVAYSFGSGASPVAMMSAKSVSCFMADFGLQRMKK